MSDDVSDECGAEDAARWRRIEDEERDEAERLVREWRENGADPATWPFRP